MSSRRETCIGIRPSSCTVSSPVRACECTVVGPLAGPLKFAESTASLHCITAAAWACLAPTGYLQRWTCSFAAPPSHARLCMREWPARFSDPSSFLATAVNIRASFPRQPPPSGKRVCHPAAATIQVTVVCNLVAFFLFVVPPRQAVPRSDRSLC